MTEVLESIVKRDDDIRLLIDQHGETYIQTNQLEPDDLEEEEGFPFVDNNMMRNAAVARPLNANVKPLSMLALSNLIVTLQILLFALPLYYWPLSRTVLIIILVLACNGFVGFYAATIALRQQYIYYSIGALELWSLSLTALLGSVAGLTHSTIPFILFGLLWLQHLVLFIYIQYASVISHVYATVMMGCATLSVWSINIVTYGSAHEWIGGIVCLFIAMLCVVYNGWQVKMANKRYNNTLNDTMHSVINYYCDVVIINLPKT